MEKSSENTTADKEDTGVTMLDVLRDEEALEEDAHAVLGGSDDKYCTYLKGYVKRQALYACMTCTPEAQTNPEKRAGICLACSYHCHENHDLIELYTKRNFRCDCGGPKMTQNKCNLDPFKSEISTENKYNQNFSGLYCECHRPYPDPEDKVADEMIQCIVCEDWYHTRHLGTKVPLAENYAEMVCKKCVEQNDFMNCYIELSVNARKDKEMNDSHESIHVDDSTSDVNVLENTQNGESPSRKKFKSDSIPSTSSNGFSKCTKPPGNALGESATLFWPEGWREKLCKCDKCITIYDTLKVSFLLDLEDRAQFYEDQGKCKTVKTSQYENGMRALQSLGHVQQVDAITEYNKMTDKLKEYLQTFADSKKVVTEADIKVFFESMKENRTSSLPPQPNFCR